MTRVERVRSPAVGRVNSRVIDGVSAVMGIEGHLVPVESSSSLLLMCLSDSSLNARLVMALYLGATGHRSRGPHMARKAMVPIRHSSSPRSVAELCRLV